jgi:hypothetical protein
MALKLQDLLEVVECTVDLKKLTKIDSFLNSKKVTLVNGKNSTITTRYADIASMTWSKKSRRFRVIIDVYRYALEEFHRSDMNVIKHREDLPTPLSLVDDLKKIIKS